MMLDKINKQYNALTEKLDEIAQKIDGREVINIHGDGANVNINVNNINIVAHTQEDIWALGDETLLRVLRSGKNFPYVMTKELSCNPKFPQNQNIYISDVNKQEVRVFNGDEWEVNKFRKVFKDIYYARKTNINALSNTLIYKKNLTEKEKLPLIQFNESIINDTILSEFKKNLVPILCNVPKALEDKK
jgi:hypothetical protein